MDNPENVFGFTANTTNAPPSRVSDQSRARTQPDNVPLNVPGDRPTKAISGGSQSNVNRGPVSGMEAALSGMADKVHPTGRLKPGEQSRG